MTEENNATTPVAETPVAEAPAAEAPMKAYDFKRLGEYAKQEGLELAEDGAERMYKATMKWLKESAKISSTPFDDLAMSFADTLDSVVMKEIDKIDGKVG